MLQVLLSISLAVLLAAKLSDQGLGQIPAQPPKPLTLKQVWMLNATYNDQQHAVTFHYPAVWQATTQFGYHPPALTQSEDAKPIAGFGFSEGGFPRTRVVGPYSGTNLEGVGIVYSAVPAASRIECMGKAASLSNTPERPPVVFGDRSFSVYDTGGAGMLQSISGKLYATYAGSTCYLFETGVAVSSPGVTDEKALTPTQLHFIDARLRDIMESVQINSKKAH